MSNIGKVKSVISLLQQVVKDMEENPTVGEGRLDLITARGELNNILHDIHLAVNREVSKSKGKNV